MENMTAEQKALVEEIMTREDPQRRVDAYVKAAKILKKESIQTKVDKIVKKELEKLDKKAKKNKKKNKKRKKKKAS